MYTALFTNRNLNEDGVRVWRSTEPFTPDTLPAEPHGLLDPGAQSYTDPTMVRGDEYYYLFETVKGSDSGWSELVHMKALPIYTGPGPQVLSHGDHRIGFYGEVPVTELVTGDALAAAIGLTSGTSQHSNEPWLKFNHFGRTLFVAKKPLRHSVSWDHIHAVGAVFGTDFTSEYQDQFLVRLLTGGEDDPASVAGGEWNQLMYPIHVDDPTGRNWGVNYTNEDLVVGVGAGRGTWVQETLASDSGRRVYRGHSSLSHFSYGTSSVALTYNGWRPVLEFQPPEG